jgi:hypothetical protein
MFPRSNNRVRGKHTRFLLAVRVEEFDRLS